MSLIAVAVWDTVENKRTELTEQTLVSLRETVDFSRHRLFIADNNSCESTKKLLRDFDIPKFVITHNENLGTALAINSCWKYRGEVEHCLKQDNDIVYRNSQWLDILEDAINQYPTIGQAACKRRDLAESPNSKDPFYKSELMMLPHKAGEKWFCVEQVKHTIGSSVLHNYRLINKIGGLFQISGNKYGFDDSAFSVRSYLAGFISVFVCNIDIEHLDVKGGDNGYTEWKQVNAGEKINAYQQLIADYQSGARDIYEPL